MTNRSESAGSRVPCSLSRRPVLSTIFLTGFMGSGKSSVGLALARALDWRFEDLDPRIEAREQRTISEIFSVDGEDRFRTIECQMLTSLIAELGSTPAVIALGGGTFVQADNFTILSLSGLTVFLDAPVEELWARCREQQQARPLRQDPEHFRNLYAARREFYTRAGVHVQTSGKSIDAIAEEIAQRLRRDYEVKESSR